MARTQRADLHQRADALLDAAAESVSGAGPRELRIEDVARRAGVGKGTVYLHWTGREHLLLAVAAREAAAVLKTVITAVRADPTEAALHRYLRRHFIEAARRPILKTIFITDHADLAALAGHPARAGLTAAKLAAARDHLAALRAHRLLRPGLDLDDVDYAVQAIAYGFFAAPPLPAPDDARSPVEYRADRLAEVVRRSFEPARSPAVERYDAAAPQVIDAFERLRDEFLRTAYGTAADRPERPALMTASDMTGLHHVGLVVDDLSEAIATFRRLGFHIAPPAYPALPPAPGAEPEPLGAGNTHADFPRSFIELLAPTPDDRERLPADSTLTVLHLPDDQLEAAGKTMRHTVTGLVERLERFEGAHILVFASADAEQTAARLTAAGFAHTGARPAQRPITTADGTRLAAIAYLEIHADDPADPATPAARMPPEGRIGAAQDAPPAVLDARTGLDHPNGALALTECVLCVGDHDLESTTERYERYLGLPAHHHAGATRGFDLGGSRFTVTTPSGLTTRLPGERPPAVPALSAYTIDVADLKATERLLRGRDIPLRKAADGRPFIPAGIAHGAAIMLRQAPTT